MLSDYAVSEIRKRSRILKEIVLSDDNTKLCRISQLLKTLSDDDDAYFLGHLYAILIDIYLKHKDYAKVIFYTNKVLLISGMALYEYCGNFCPFTSEKIPQLLAAYEQEEKAGNYMEVWGKGRILQLQNKFEGAISFYRNIITKQPDNVNAYRMCARVYEEIHDFSKAHYYLKKAKKLSDDPLTACMIANIEITQFNFTNAETLLNETIKKHPKSSIAEYRLVLYGIHKDTKQEDYRKCLLKNNPANTKYILYTINKYDEETKQELEQLLSTVKDGYDYTSTNKYFGDWYFENKNDDNTFEQNTKALEYYTKAIKNNKYCYLAYYNKINILMRTPAALSYKDSTANEDKNFIQTFKDTFPYYIEDYLNLMYGGLPLEKQIKNYTKEIKKNPLKINLYFLLADAYLQQYPRTHHKDDIINLCKEVTEKFRSSFYAFYGCYFYYRTIKKYKKAKFCINKCLKYSGNYTRICQIAEEIKYFTHPKTYKQLIKSTEEKFKDELDSRFYLELAAYYFNECYKLRHTNKDYPDISLELMERAIDKDPKVLDDHENRLLYALLLMYTEREKEAYKTYGELSEEKYDLLKQIKICWDIFDINLLYKLFTHNDEQNEKNSNDHTKNIKFLTHLLLYLLQYNLFNDQEYAISHYTSVNALSAMLSDDGMSPFRLSSLGSANDPKEGKILYDFLSTELSKKDVYLQLQNTPVNDYTAVQASFTKLEDALTMFRLYGKVEKNEGTGVNLVFNKHFFSEKLETPLRKEQQKIARSKDKNDPIKFHDKTTMQQTEPLYWVLYWDTKHNKMYFNPQGIYKTLEIHLDNHKPWQILNEHQKELQKPDPFYANYAANISFVLNELRKEFTAHITHHNTPDDIDTIKEHLLNISYLIKDIAFYDEKELRMIKVEFVTGNDKLKHDESSLRLYRDYSKLSGFYHYPKTSVLDKIIIGPKVEQKETLKEYLLHHLDKAGMGFVTVEISNAPLA